MDMQIRRENVHDQENINGGKKAGGMIQTKRLGLKTRGALGEINLNTTTAQSQADDCEIDKKIGSRRIVRSYKHVQSKVDTGLPAKTTFVQPSSRPPLRREESTARLAARAVVTRAVLKDTQKKVNEVKESVNVFVQAKKVFQDKKNLPTLKEDKEPIRSLLKPTVNEPTESLGKLKLRDNEDATKNKQEIQKPEHLSPKLPENIEDIDEDDANSALLMTHYIKDIYKYLTDQEKVYAINEDYLAKQTVINGKMRATLIDWLVEVQKQFSLELDTFHLTIGIIDRYLQAKQNVQRNQLQLIGVTAMFIASKYEEVYAPQVDDFVFITDNAYTKSDVFKCEVDILNKLGYCLARPLPISFLRRFVKVAHGASKNHHLAKYFVDLCLVEYSMAHYRPSELAAAAICLSLYLLSTKALTDIWTPTLSYYSCYTLDHIKPIVKKIAKIVINVENSKHKAVYNKYLDKSLAKVSSLPQLKSETIHEIANNKF